MKIQFSPQIICSLMLCLCVSLSIIDQHQDNKRGIRSTSLAGRQHTDWLGVGFPSVLLLLRLYFTMLGAWYLVTAGWARLLCTDRLPHLYRVGSQCVVWGCGLGLPAQCSLSGAATVRSTELQTAHWGLGTGVRRTTA